MASTLDAQLVKDIAPELALESDTRIELFIDIVKLRNDADVWGDKYNYACALDACHELTMANRNGSGGSVTSEKVGDVSVSYGGYQSGKNQIPYDLTAYGQMYLNLRKTILVTPIIV